MYESPFNSPESSTVLRAGWRFRRAVVLAVAVGLIAGLAYGLSTDAHVTATTNLVLRDAAQVDQSIPQRNQSGAYERFVESQALFATSDEVLTLVANERGVSLEDIRDRVDASSQSSGRSLRFSSQGTDEDDARDLVDAHVQAYQGARAARVADDTAVAREVLENAADALNDDARGALDVAAVELQIAAQIYGDGVAFADRVIISESSGIVRLGLPTAGGAMILAAMALVLAAMADDRSPLVLGAHTLISRRDLPLRGTVPTRPELRAHAYDRLGAEIERAFAPGDADRTAVLLTVGVDIDRDSQVETTSETGASLADSGLKVCVVDCTSVADNAHPTQPKGFEPVDAEATTYESTTGRQLTLVRAAESRRALHDYARDASFTNYMRSLRDCHEIVLVSCSPLDESTGALKMAAHCDQAVVIVPAGARIHEVERTLYTLRQAGVRLAGYISTDEPVRVRPSHWWST